MIVPNEPREPTPGLRLTRFGLALARLRSAFAETPPTTVFRLRWTVASLIVSGLLCPAARVSASGAVSAATELPAPVTMNRGAGEGMLLLVEVNTATGERFRCAVDTGSPNTVLPARLEPVLGKRLGARRFFTLDSSNEVEHLYAAPKLYLGKTRLLTGTQVGASGNLGILGMDCLRHYCIQLDFEAGVMRFVSSDQLKIAELGKPYPLWSLRYATIKHQAFFQEEQVNLLIDTGCPFDGYLTPRAFKRAVREQHAQSLPLSKDGVVQGKAPGMALFSRCVWEGESYTNLILGKRFNLVGLRFLGRHLVTFDFPRGTLYLKRRGGDGAQKMVSVNPKPANQLDAANGSQPIPSPTNSMSSAAGSRR